MVLGKQGTRKQVVTFYKGEAVHYSQYISKKKEKVPRVELKGRDFRERDWQAICRFIIY